MEKEGDGQGKNVGPAVAGGEVQDRGRGRSRRSQLIHRLGIMIYVLGILDM